jgi:hypothetical protein
MPALGGALCVVLGAAELLYVGTGTGNVVIGLAALAFGGVVLLDSLQPAIVATRESLCLRQFLRVQVLPWDRVERFVVRRTTLYSCVGVELTDGANADCKAAQASSKSKAGQAQLQAWVVELNRFRESRRWDS